jgi:hypothetical protein
LPCQLIADVIIAPAFWRRRGQGARGVTPICLFAKKQIGMAEASSAARKFLKNHAYSVFQKRRRLTFKFV